MIWLAVLRLCQNSGKVSGVLAQKQRGEVGPDEGRLQDLGVWISVLPKHSRVQKTELCYKVESGYSFSPLFNGLK